MQMPTDMFSRYRKERRFQLGSISKLEAVRTGCITHLFYPA